MPMDEGPSGAENGAQPAGKAVVGRRTLAVKVVVPEPAVVEAAIEPVAAVAIAPVGGTVIAPVAVAPAIEPVLDTAAPQRVDAAPIAPQVLPETTSSRSRHAWTWITSSRTRLFGTAGIIAAIVLMIAFVPLPGGDDDADATSTNPAVARAIETPKPTSASADAVAGQAVPDAAVSIEQASARKQLRVHEGIVFAPVHAPKRKFDDARKQCAEMNTGAIQGWRLPTLAELHVLALAEVVDRGVYWSGTEADAFGTHALIWSEKKTAAVPITKAWGGARALCVRDESP